MYDREWIWFVINRKSKDCVKMYYKVVEDLKELHAIFDKMLKFVIVILFITFCQGSMAQNGEMLSIDLSDEIVQPKVYVIPSSHERLTIDGKADEADWNFY